MKAIRHLRALFAPFVDIPAAADIALSDITMDSRRVTEGALFLACAGTRGHGAAFIDDAVCRGAAAVAVETVGEPKLDAVELPDRHVPVIAIPSLRESAGLIADRFFGEPSAACAVVGVTGTNGKTSVSQFIGRALAVDAPAGIIGTLGSGMVGRLKSTGHTTPDPVSVHATLADFVTQGARAVAMEVSSHGLHQGRVNGVRFKVGVFTNLTHEHLDYHGTLEAYAEAKRLLFQAPGLETAVINTDDAVGRSWLAALPSGVRVVSYGLETAHTPILKGLNLQLTPAGASFDVRSPWGEARIESRLLGRFNASNLLAALGALLALGMPMEIAARRLSAMRAVPGRMEQFGGAGRATALVDYAHTPDALEQVLSAARAHCRGRLWCVFGCGGNRDRAKRPVMGKVAERLADVVILTDDNPRHEDPDFIIQEILRGMHQNKQYKIIRDRADAITFALGGAHEGDVVVIAGKGHEADQQIGDVRLPFSDRAVVAAYFGQELSDE